MELSDVGKVAHDYWLEIPQHSRFAEVGAFVIMSNHMHGLLRIVGNPPSRNMTLENTESDSVHYHHAISPSKGSVSQIVRGYKSAVTRVVRSFYQDFAWQSSFHDHIVREGEFDRIEQYILNNAKNWEEDGFYSAG
ncbi:MAG TPA: transposase, partial [Cytophagales bacterium]|nr:transposase [Cytophagales bacterium]HAP57955.1 transposase [Cytophagales bacterium]